MTRCHQGVCDGEAGGRRVK